MGRPDGRKAVLRSLWRLGAKYGPERKTHDSAFDRNLPHDFRFGRDYDEAYYAYATTDQTKMKAGPLSALDKLKEDFEEFETKVFLFVEMEKEDA